MAEIDNLLLTMVGLGASDLHVRVGCRPRCRVQGRLAEMPQVDPLSRADVERLLGEILSDEQRAVFAAQRELDFTYGDGKQGRYRFNYFLDHWGPAASVRRIPVEIPTLEELGMPDSVEQFAHLRRGFVLITGSTGSGKTSTLAALVDVINEHYCKHVITLEDPIEFVHGNKRSVVHQRALHEHIQSFEQGIAQAQRQNPDVIVIGELRDLESIRRALTAAETGLLVFATLHTNSAADSVDRIIDVFPASEQSHIRTQLAQSLAGVLCQTLVERRDGGGRVPAVEILVATPALAGIVRDGNTHDIVNVIQGGRNLGMCTLDDSLERLVKTKTIDPREAYVHAHNKKRFEGMMPRSQDLATMRGEVPRPPVAGRR